MGFSDELRSIAKAHKEITTDKMYKDVLHCTYNFVKHLIKENVKKTGILRGSLMGSYLAVSSNNFSSLVPHPYNAPFWKTDLFVLDSEGSVNLPPLCQVQYKQNLFSSQACVSFVGKGEKIMKDIQALAKADGLTLTFKPTIGDYGKKIEFDRFGVYYPIPKDHRKVLANGNYFNIYYTVQ